MDAGKVKKAFSLTEVLIAIGVLAMGMIFIAGAFPVGMFYATVQSEQTIAINVAEEAFAKIKLYGITEPSGLAWGGWPKPPSHIYNEQLSANYDFIWPQYSYTIGSLTQPLKHEFYYPSAYSSTLPEQYKQYSWSAICRPVANHPGSFQVTVFVSRSLGLNKTYYWRDDIISLRDDGGRPLALSILVEHQPSMAADELQLIVAGPEEFEFVDAGYDIVEDKTGTVFKVTERYKYNNNWFVRLSKPWPFPGGQRRVWVVPPAVSGGRKPCIAVYQRVINFLN